MTADKFAHTAPPRGTRPRNRRAMIVSAATDLFNQFGYEQVSMSDVARAVNVGASALYRHFASKPQLLTAVVVEEMRPFREAFTDPEVDSVDDVADRLAGLAADRHLLGALWQQEARSLPDDEYKTLRHEVGATLAMLTELLRNDRPDLGERDASLFAQCACSVLCSLSTSREELPRVDYARMLRGVMRQILTANPGPQSRRRVLPNVFAPMSRREQLLSAAIAAFAERGYAAVSMDEIGARAGISGPSVYYHYASKQHLLSAAYVRGDEWLRHDMYRALARAESAVQAVRRLLGSYVDFAAARSDLIDVVMSESRHLPDDKRTRFEQSQREYLGEWTHLMQEAGAPSPEPEARARAHAALNMINDIARTPHLRDAPGVLDTLKALAIAMLLGDDPGGLP